MASSPENESSAAAVVSRGESLMRFQDDSMQAVAVQRPRQISEVRDKALEEVNAFPELADRYFYSIPHRSARCQHPTTQACPSCEYVEGPSINAALALQRYWGNCASTCRIEFEDADYVHTVGIFTDYERNTRFEKPYRASKWLLKRDGKRIKLNDQRLTMAVNAAASKAQRNAILSAIPDPLKILLWTTAKALVVGDEPDKKLTEKQVKQIADSFAQWNASLELLEKKLGKKSTTWTMSDRARLIGLHNALKDGETTEAIFGVQVKKTAGKPAEAKAAAKPKAAQKPEPVPIATGEPVEEEHEPDTEEEDTGPEPPPAVVDDGHAFQGGGFFCSACGGKKEEHAREPGDDDEPEDLFSDDDDIA